MDLLLSAVACSNISNHLIEEDGQQYLILPVSRQKVRVEKEHIPLLDNIDIDLLEAAEEKITEKITQYTKEREHFYLQEEDGHLLLCVEVIVSIENPSSSSDGFFIDIDHEHKFITERITK